MMPPQPNRTAYLGIDNGSNGGIALLYQGVPITHKIPDDEKDLLELLKEVARKYIGTSTLGTRYTTVAAIEQQIPRPTVFFDKSIGKMKSSILKSTCTLYAEYMQTRICLLTAGIPFQAVVPETWQKEIGLPHKKQTRSDNTWKNVLKDKAQELFPDHKVTLWNADAILITEYCRRIHSPSLRRTKAIR